VKKGEKEVEGALNDFCAGGGQNLKLRHWADNDSFSESSFDYTQSFL